MVLLAPELSARRPHCLETENGRAQLTGTKCLTMLLMNLRAGKTRGANAALSDKALGALVVDVQRPVAIQCNPYRWETNKIGETDGNELVG